MPRDTDDRVVKERIDRSENIQAFLKVLDPADNATGGGAASAVAGAMGAALVAMVARLSIGRRGMGKGAFYKGIDREARALAMDLFAGGHRDSQAFEAVRASHKLPVETEDQRGVRRAAIQRAIVGATRVPLENGEACKRVLDLCMRLKGRSNPNAASDLECAQHLARAGLVGCLANVEINLPSIGGQESATVLAERGRTLREYVEANIDRTPVEGTFEA